MFGNQTSLLILLPLLACNNGEDTEDQIADIGAPVAFAGADQVVSADEPIQLDASGSYDPNGDDIIFHWVLQRAPEGSSSEEGAFPNNHTATQQTLLRPDLPGTYIVELWVEDARGNLSAPDLVTITVVAGTAPIADARGPDHALTGDTITLDASWSYDPKGHDLTYSWAVSSAPSNSALSGFDAPDQVSVSAMVDIPGTYVFALIVNNGFVGSAPSLVYVDVEPETPHAPIADVGDGEVTGQDCTTLSLDGSDSYDPDGATLDYNWEFQSVPDESAISTRSFDDASSPTPSFFPDVAGTYVASLAVFDGTEWSEPSLVNVEATERVYNSTPEVEVGATIWADLGNATCYRRTDGGYDCDPCAPQLIDLGAEAVVSDADGDELTLEWSPFTDANMNIVNSDTLEAEALFDDVYPDGPSSCEQTLYHIWLKATDCPGATGSDLLSVWATCCGQL